MKLVIILITALAMIGCSQVAEAALTAEEETFVGQLLTNKAKLIELYKVADGLTNEKAPVEIAALQQERDALIAARDAEIQAENVASDNKVQGIETAYEVLIDEKDSAITALRNSI